MLFCLPFHVTYFFKLWCKIRLQNLQKIYFEISVVLDEEFEMLIKLEISVNSIFSYKRKAIIHFRNLVHYLKIYTLYGDIK